MNDHSENVVANKFVQGLTIKICGLTREQDLEAVITAGIDQAGFVFTPSRRRLSILQAASLIRQLPASILPVGVFADTEPSVIIETIEKTGIRAVQLHGSEPASYIRILRYLLPNGIEIWKNFSYSVMSDESRQAAASQKISAKMSIKRSDVNSDKNRSVTEKTWSFNDIGQPDAWLLDSKFGNQSGGTGKAFNWAEAAQSLPPGRRILAGGLDINNVYEAINLIKPNGIDCSSGVETNGIKDRHKILEFCKFVRTISNH